MNPGLIAGAGLAVLAAVSSLGGGKSKAKAGDKAAQKAKVRSLLSGCQLQCTPPLTWQVAWHYWPSQAAALQAGMS